MIQFSYCRYNKSHKEEVIELLPNLWRKTVAESKELFEWKYEQNPFTSEPFCFVALNENKVVGFRGYLIQEFLFDEKKGRIAALADTITHPEYRRMGMFEELTNFSLQEMDKDEDIVCSYNLSASWHPTGGYIKLGWQPIALRHSLYYLNLFNIIKSFFQKKDHSIAKFLIEDFKFNLKNSNLKVEISKSVHAESLNKLASKAGNLNGHFRNSKSIEYYSWRFKNPSSKFIFAYMWDNEELVSFIAFNIVSQKTLVIVDFMFTIERYMQFLINATKKSLNPSIISVWTIAQPESSLQVFKKSGFISLKHILKRFKRFNHPPALVRPNKFQLDNESWTLNGLDLRDEKNWVLFKIDSDAG